MASFIKFHLILFMIVGGVGLILYGSYNKPAANFSAYSSQKQKKVYQVVPVKKQQAKKIIQQQRTAPNRRLVKREFIPVTAESKTDITKSHAFMRDVVSACKLTRTRADIRLAQIRQEGVWSGVRGYVWSKGCTRDRAFLKHLEKKYGVDPKQLLGGNDGEFGFGQFLPRTMAWIMGYSFRKNGREYQVIYHPHSDMIAKALGKPGPHNPYDRFVHLVAMCVYHKVAKSLVGYNAGPDNQNSAQGKIYKKRIERRVPAAQRDLKRSGLWPS